MKVRESKFVTFTFHFTHSKSYCIKQLVCFTIAGRLGPGDLILAVNGQSMAQVSNER